jgi:hypothetical protein
MICRKLHLNRLSKATSNFGKLYFENPNNLDSRIMDIDLDMSIGIEILYCKNCKQLH